MTSGVADRAFSTTAEAYATADGPWEHAVQDAIGALFDFLAAEGPQTLRCLTADPTSDRYGLASREATIERFVKLLEPDRATGYRNVPGAVTEAIGGAVFELVRIHALENRLDSLSDALPSAVLIALTPFVGSVEAERLAASTPV